MVKKIFLFLIVFILTATISFFIFTAKYFYIPQLSVRWNDYLEQSEFQWIYEENYFVDSNRTKLDKNFLYTFSLIPQGYVRYKKVGDEIEFFLKDNQLFWKRKSSAYPYFEPYGRFIITINADRTVVEVFEVNGQKLYEFDGLFLVDLKCIEKSRCYLLYNDGKFIFFDEKNDFFLNAGIEHAFFKSFSVKNNQVVFHYFLGSQDYFGVYEIFFDAEKPYLKKYKEIQSNIVFPYTISFQHNFDSILIPNFRETIILKDKKIYKLFIENQKISFSEIKNQNDLSLDVSFLGESVFYKNIVFVLKENLLEVYDSHHNFLFYMPINQSKGSFFTYRDKLYIFFDDMGYLEVGLVL
jgi:hypothetical protein